MLNCVTGGRSNRGGSQLSGRNRSRGPQREHEGPLGIGRHFHSVRRSRRALAPQAYMDLALRQRLHACDILPPEQAHRQVEVRVGSLVGNLHGDGEGPAPGVLELIRLDPGGRQHLAELPLAAGKRRAAIEGLLDVRLFRDRAGHAQAASQEVIGRLESSMRAGALEAENSSREPGLRCHLHLIGLPPGIRQRVHGQPLAGERLPDL